MVDKARQNVLVALTYVAGVVWVVHKIRGNIGSRRVD